MPENGAGGPGEPALSVVIVTWNSAGDIGRAVASARSPSSQVIVVDNASTDDSIAAARAAGADVIVDAGANLGFSAGCNLGLRHVSASIVLFLNPDAALDGGAGEALLEFFASHPTAAILGPAVRDESGRRSRTAGHTWSLATELANKSMLHRFVRPLRGTGRVAWVSGAALAARVESLRDLGGFDPGFFLYYEDLDLCARAVSAGLEVWFSDAVGVTHSGKRSSRRVEERALLISQASTQRYWRRHGGHLDGLVVRAMTMPEMLLRSLVWALLSIDPARRAQGRVRLRAYRRILRGVAGFSVPEDPVGKEGSSSETANDSSSRQGPLVSVVIPTFNRADMVGRAIESALAQDYHPVEVIVVDDGSTDDTPAVLERYADSVRTIRQENRGEGAARNAGIAASTGEFVAFLDSDDEWRPRHLAPLVDRLLLDPTVGLAYRQAEFYKDESGEVFDVFPRRPLEGEIFLQAAEKNPMVVDSVLVWRAVLEQVGLFDEGLKGGADWELWARCLAVSRVAFVPGVTVRVHYHGRNTLGNRPVMEQGIRAATEKILNHPTNGPRLAPHRRRLRAGMWALLAHMNMLAGDGKAARARLWEGVQEDPYVVTYPVFWTMALKALVGTGLVHRGRLVRRRLHLRRVGGTLEQPAARADRYGSPTGLEPRLVTVVVPCFNARRWLPGCLESIQSQSYGGVEIIVVDGGSKDGTTEFLASKEGLTWVSEPDEGQSDAIAKGFEMAKGDVLCWVNADDRLRPRACEVVVAAMERTGADLVFGSAEIVDAEGRRIRLVHAPEHLRLRDFVNDVAVPQPSTFFSAALFRSVGGVDRSKHLSFDTDLWIRFAAAGAKVTRVPIVLSEVIYHEETKTSTHTHAAFRREAASAMEKFGGDTLAGKMRGVVASTQLFDEGIPPDRIAEAVATALAGQDDELMGAGAELVRRASRRDLVRLIPKLMKVPPPMQRGAARSLCWRIATGIRSRRLDRTVKG